MKDVTTAGINDRTAAVVECISRHLDELATRLAKTIQDVEPAYRDGPI